MPNDYGINLTPPDDAGGAPLRGKSGTPPNDHGLNLTPAGDAGVDITKLPTRAADYGLERFRKPPPAPKEGEGLDTGWIETPQSSWVQSIRWVVKSQGGGGELYVFYYRKGRKKPNPFVAIYDVKKSVFEGLWGAASKGEFIHHAQQHLYKTPYREGQVP